MDRELALAIVRVLGDIVLVMWGKPKMCVEKCANGCVEEPVKECEELITPLKVDVEEFGNILSRQQKPQMGRYRVPVNSEHHLPPP